MREHGLYLTQRWGWFAALHRRLRRTREYDAKCEFALGDPDSTSSAVTQLLLARATDPTAPAVRAANDAFLLKRLDRFVPQIFPSLPEGASPVAFPIQSDRKEELLHRLAGRGIAAVDFWSTLHPCLPVEGFPRAAALRESIIALPVH